MSSGALLLALACLMFVGLIGGLTALRVVLVIRRRQRVEAILAQLPFSGYPPAGHPATFGPPAFGSPAFGSPADQGGSAVFGSAADQGGSAWPSRYDGTPPS